jgi:hypothetical protein
MAGLLFVLDLIFHYIRMGGFVNTFFTDGCEIAMHRRKNVLSQTEKRNKGA